MRRHFLLGLWLYINYLLTYLLTNRYTHLIIVVVVLLLLVIGARFFKQVKMYYRSGTDGRCCIRSGQMLRLLSPDGSTFLSEK